jgi:hypothetical protein
VMSDANVENLRAMPAVYSSQTIQAFLESWGLGEEDQALGHGLKLCVSPSRTMRRRPKRSDERPTERRPVSLGVGEPRRCRWPCADRHRACRRDTSSPTSSAAV